ncbi:hypothetical protein A0256_08955 [Mucilaginibacter sp. PAMC 26640]|nr:hypothetical protein A0256_08955 [Mucilaginibacter sp. PAMC 26640]
MKAVFAERFYYTTVDNRRMYARIRRSPDQRFYALFISSSLITILHKLVKLSLAIHFPEMVLDCSRNPGQQVSCEQLIEMYVETYAHFRETKLPLGPQIILDKQLDYPHFLTLTIQEKLLAYHEIAHFLNGDLETDADDVQKLSADYPNINYQREHYADLVGFGLLLREEKIFDKVTKQDRIRMLFALINLFGILYDLQGPETSDYPHPYNRLLCII